MSLADRVKYAEMKARHVKVLRPWYKKWWGVLTLVILGLIMAAILSAGLYVYSEVKNIQSGKSEDYLKKQRQAYLNLINGPGGYNTGPVNAKITVVEFTDFACPFCQQASPEIRQLAEEYKDNLKLVIRDYPIHANSINLALAARCAGEQGKYWEAYDSLFANQANLMGTSTIEADIFSWASFLKLDELKFQSCFTDRRYIDVIKRDYDDGNSLNVQGTPTWFVNNYPITGVYPIDKFRELFNGILQQINNSKQ